MSQVPYRLRYAARPKLQRSSMIRYYLLTSFCQLVQIRVTAYYVPIFKLTKVAFIILQLNVKTQSKIFLNIIKIRAPLAYGDFSRKGNNN